MNKQPTRRPTACRAAARTLAIATAMAALVATLGAGQALAGPDERVLERQGSIDRHLAAAQADEQGRVTLPPQLSSEDKAAFAQAERERSRQAPVRVPRRYLPPEPPMSTESRLDIEQPAPAPAPLVPADSRTGLAVTLAVVALLLAVGAAMTWRIHRRPRPEPTT
jgi:hypothetical protein